MEVGLHGRERDVGDLGDGGEVEAVDVPEDRGGAVRLGEGLEGGAHAGGVGAVAIYSVDPTKERLYVGQQLDVFIATADDVATAQ